MDQSSEIFLPVPLSLRLTRTHECAYLPGKTEQRLAADITHHPEYHDKLARAGYRRVENWVYKPACKSCQACLPIRIDASRHQLSRNLQRIWRSNQDLQRTGTSKPVGEEHYKLFIDYLTHRHKDGQMAAMSFDEFRNMVHNSPLETVLVEYRSVDGSLIGCMLTDVQSDGLSAVYSFFAPYEERRSLGSFMIIDLMELCREMDLQWLYLGYYVSESPKMQYKARFSPAEIFLDGIWQPLKTDQA